MDEIDKTWNGKDRVSCVESYLKRSTGIQINVRKKYFFKKKKILNDYIHHFPKFKFTLYFTSICLAHLLKGSLALYAIRSKLLEIIAYGTQDFLLLILDVWQLASIQC